ncbi:hypothetical protein [Actinomadura sp. WMMA1423]|uniref:hypothetical protein n=1 Tax=Actinomadura sp. WMMA1423 TaxID=2591108 RepID=UPI00143DCF69|nr:hypothetical protein [Actinomadura sp. WMMA1423]
MYCFTCGDEREFEQPPCEDGHGEECPEWGCVDCGSAVLVDPPPVAAPVPGRASETAPARGRAATARAVA